MDFLTILLKKGVITSEDAKKAQSEAASPQQLEDILKSYGVSSKDILEAKGQYMSVPTRVLSSPNIPMEILKFIPEDSANYYKILPLDLKAGALEVGVVDPENLDARDAINFITSKNNVPYKIFLISKEDYEKAMLSYKGLSGEVTKALSELEDDLSDEEREMVNIKDEEVGKKINSVNIIEDAPVKKIVATILRYAIEGEASDVHVEPMADKVRVRFRLDGVLHTSLILPAKVLNAVVARIKILSDMKLDEKRKPQDGRFSARIDGRKIDFRVSTFPTYYGEKVVMRILDQTQEVLNL